MASLKIYIAAALIAIAAACSQTPAPNSMAANTSPAVDPTPKLELADSFAYPVGIEETVTAKKDKDAWFKEVEFGQNDSLGEHWTFNEGGNKACGDSVYAAANGNIVYADFAGPEWGYVMIVEHELPSGERVQTLYGGLLDIAVQKGSVKKRQILARVGNANGRYLCRLHFEIRTPQSAAWNQPGAMNSPDKTGWLAPSNFIDSHR
ncbi:MAG: peptidoglycan DD-metalloendopeptidase family protein [Pyrinomonadaceae bacterium]